MWSIVSGPGNVDLRSSTCLPQGSGTRWGSQERNAVQDFPTFLPTTASSGGTSLRWPMPTICCSCPFCCFIGGYSGRSDAGDRGSVGAVPFWLQQDWLPSAVAERCMHCASNRRCHLVEQVEVSLSANGRRHLSLDICTYSRAILLGLVAQNIVIDLGRSLNRIIEVDHYPCS